MVVSSSKLVDPQTFYPAGFWRALVLSVLIVELYSQHDVTLEVDIVVANFILAYETDAVPGDFPRSAY